MDLSTITPDEVSDTRGLTCPMPLLKTKKALKKVKSGKILEVLGDDPGSKKDIPDFCEKGGDQFLGMLDLKEGYTKFYIQKG